MHPKLLGHPTDYSRFGALALQRAGHVSPVPAAIVHDGIETAAEIAWLPQNFTERAVLDENRITEEGAEAVALVYVGYNFGWVVKRRFQRGESADWLLHNDGRWLALEVSGTAVGDPFARLENKIRQVAHCTLATQERLAVVVAFDGPLIVAGSA